MGAVGTIMSNYCKAFGMNVITYDHYKIIHDTKIKQYNNLQELIKKSLYSIQELCKYSIRKYRIISNPG